MLLVLGGFFPAALAKHCLETGDIPVHDLTTCKSAADQMKKNFAGMKADATRPKGCYLSGSIYFNNHLTGSLGGAAQQICMIKG